MTDNKTTVALNLGALSGVLLRHQKKFTQDEWNEIKTYTEEALKAFWKLQDKQDLTANDKWELNKR